jgi:hypothetical protein
MKKIKLFLIISFIFAWAIINGQPQTAPFIWYSAPSGTLEDIPYGIITDFSGGNIYVTGKFQSKPLNMGNGISITHTGMKDYFIAKYDGQGNCVWAHEGGGDVTTEGRDVVIDQNGEIVVTGALYGNSIFGGIPLTGSGNWDVVVVKYDIAGNVLWAKKGSSKLQDRGNGVTIDGAGNYIVVGYFGGAGVDTVNFSGYKLTGYGDRDIFVAKYNSAGELLWVKAAGSINNGEEGWGVATDNDNNIYVSGHFQGTATFGTLQATSMAVKDGFVAKLSPDGEFLWVKTLASPKDVSVADLDISSSKNEIAVVGYFTDTLVVNNTMYFSNGGEDAYIARYSLNGDLISFYNFGSASNERASAIAAAGGNRYWIGGYFYGSMTLGGVNYTSAGARDAYMTMVDENNQHLYVNIAAGTDENYCTAIASDGAGNAYATGNFKGTMSLGNFNLTSAGSDEIYVTRIGDWVVPVELVSFNANFQNGNVLLNWVTATETNNFGFEIERSFDKINFEKIGFVNGKGNSSVISNYNFVDNSVLHGVVYYRLKQIDYNGSINFSNIVEVNLNIPDEFVLEQNYPNPFNPSTTISYNLKNDGIVLLKVYDVLGKEVETLINQVQNKGYYKVNFDAQKLSGGIYFYNLKVTDKLSGSLIFNQSKKMILVK